MRFSALNAKEFFRIAKLILNNDPKGKQFMQILVDGIINDLKKRAYKEALPDEDDNLDNVDFSDIDL
jgi:hypothetical protein